MMKVLTAWLIVCIFCVCLMCSFCRLGKEKVKKSWEKETEKKREKGGKLSKIKEGSFVDRNR